MREPHPARVVLRGGHIVDARGLRRADVVVAGSTIVAVGDASAAAGGGRALLDPCRDDVVIDCTGRLVLPGFVDAHSHVDGLLGDDDVQRALLRQGVTSVITGQDGVSYAPGDGAYATEYFGAINGPSPAYSGGGVAAYLAGIDGTSRLNAAYLAPAGTVRFEVCGRAAGPATPSQVAEMVALVDEAMDAGAVGLSTGLDYVPGLFQSSDEIAALCAPVARSGGVYVTHMRGGYEAAAGGGIDEVAAIAETTRAATGLPLPVHVSHFHADADIVLGQLDRLQASGIDATFDAYPYIRGCSLMGMPLLPAELSARPADEIVQVLSDPQHRAALRAEWFPRVQQHASLGERWPHMITLAHLAAPALAWAHGMTIAEAAARSHRDEIDFVLDALRDCRLQANIVMAVQNERPAGELARIFAHPAHMGGSDAIFIGAHPHPRARGTFARYLREYVRERRTWSWPDAAWHLSAAAVRRFGLGRRGEVSPGAVADLIVVDPDTVSDTATYARPLGDAVGIDDVLVAGTPVLVGGELTPARPGRGLRRAPHG